MRLPRCNPVSQEGPEVRSSRGSCRVRPGQGAKGQRAGARREPDGCPHDQLGLTCHAIRSLRRLSLSWSSGCSLLYSSVKKACGEQCGDLRFPVPQVGHMIHLSGVETKVSERCFEVPCFGVDLAVADIAFLFFTGGSLGSARMGSRLQTSGKYWQSGVPGPPPAAPLKTVLS